MKTPVEPIVGRYTHYDIDGRNCRIYFEEAGQGIPLVCLHTAGADGRQFRHMLCNPQITSRYRVLVYDMPWHGKSYPPEDWLGDEEYRLSTDLYVKTVMAFCEALEIEKPVILGSSIGGRIILQLARLYPEKFRALIGLQTGLFQSKPVFDINWLHRGDVHGGEVCAGLMSGLCAPTSPLRYRMETLWQYMQSGPGVHKGDLWFFRVEGDLRGKLEDIDTTKCPLYLLTGEYDYACTPDGTLEVAKSIPGAKVRIMKEIGHFPMSENPEKFHSYLLPVLDEIVSE
jgi:pimeloyl-ACP methyl ester carboxylesterase